MNSSELQAVIRKQPAVIPVSLNTVNDGQAADEGDVQTFARELGTLIGKHLARQQDVTRGEADAGLRL